MNIKKVIIAGIMAAVVGALALDYVEVIDVTARQRYPWNGLVDIDFELDSHATEPYMMKVTVIDNVGKTNLPVRTVYTENVSQKDNPCMVTKDTTRIVWDAAADLPDGFKCTNVLVTCQDTRCTPSNRLYCVIDLSAGSSASSYPVSYLDSVPAGGWTDAYKKTKLVFRRIEAGSFMMGSPDDEINRNSNENYHRVTLTQPYYIGVFELTEAQYKLIAGGSASSMKPMLTVYGAIRGYDYTGSAETSYSWPKYTAVDSSSVVGKLRTKTGISTIDLPTEAQWEMAAKGASITGLNTGYSSSESSMNITGRYEGNKSDGRGDASSSRATYVGMYMPNAYGLYDMLGNAREWCLDSWKETLGTAAATNPKGNSAISTGDSNGYGASSYASRRVLKGGGFYIEHYFSTNYDRTDAALGACRSAYRTYGWSRQDSYGVFFSEGFRLVFIAQ